MKNKLLLCLFFVVTTYAYQAYAQQLQYSYILKIRLPNNAHNTMNILGYYQGKEFKINGGCIMLPEKQERLAFSVIITPEVDHKAIKNNIWHLKTLPHVPCRWFDLTLSFESAENGKIAYQWAIEEQPITTTTPLRIPDHAILIQTDPKLIEKLENPHENIMSKKLCSSANTQAAIIYFPTIVFNNTVSTQEFEEALIYPLLASMDIRAIHQEID